MQSLLFFVLWTPLFAQLCRARTSSGNGTFWISADGLDFKRPEVVGARLDTKGTTILGPSSCGGTIQGGNSCNRPAVSSFAFVVESQSRCAPG